MRDAQRDESIEGPLMRLGKFVSSGLRSLFVASGKFCYSKFFLEFTLEIFGTMQVSSLTKSL